MFKALGAADYEELASQKIDHRSEIGQEKRAGDRIRTDDIHVGNVTL